MGFAFVKKSWLWLVLLLLVACRQAPQEHSTKTVTAPVSSSFSFQTPADLKAFLSWSADRQPLISAHRGGPYPGFPENSLAAFDHARQYGPLLIECDIALSKDSVLVLMHDETIDRTTNGQGKLTDWTYADLQGLNLKDENGELTEHKIPRLTEVLDWGRGKVIFTLDLKGAPLDLVVQAIRQQQAEAYSVIITYNFQAAQEVYALAPELMISVSGQNFGDLKRIENSGIPPANLMAFVGTAERKPELYEALHQMGIRATLGTLGNLDRRMAQKGDAGYLKFYENGADILATDRPLEVARQLQKWVPTKTPSPQ